MSEEHVHCHGCESGGKTETVALLKYMIDHNRHHTDELNDLAHSADGRARELIYSAIIEFETANAKLEEALALLQE